MTTLGGFAVRAVAVGMLCATLLTACEEPRQDAARSRSDSATPRREIPGEGAGSVEGSSEDNGALEGGGEAANVPCFPVGFLLPSGTGMVEDAPRDVPTIRSAVSVVSDPMPFGEEDDGPLVRWWLMAAETPDGVALWQTNMPPNFGQGDRWYPREVPKKEARQLCCGGDVFVNYPLNELALEFVSEEDLKAELAKGYDVEAEMPSFLAAIGRQNPRLLRAIECAKEAKPVL